MEKLPRTLLRRREVLPPDHTPGNTEAAECPCSWLLFIWSGGPADVLSEWRSTALVNLALFLLVLGAFGWLLSPQAFCLNRQFD